MHDDKPVMLITGTSSGIGKMLAHYYASRGYHVVGCSRNSVDFEHASYRHFNVDVCNEASVVEMFRTVSSIYKRLDVLINNAGVASMNHSLLTPASTVNRIFETNYLGTFLASREASKIMLKKAYGRIVNFVSVAVPMKIEGEAVYASSKAAVLCLTEVLAKELSGYGITVNAIGPNPIETDLIKNVPEEKIKEVLSRQAIRRYSSYDDVSNVVDFFIKKESNMVTGQVIYLGGV